MLRFFTSDLRRNIIKIVCLTLGLSIGLLLIAKVYFETTFDSFYEDSDNLYIVTEHVTRNGEYQEHWQTPGGIGPGMKRHVPQVTVATRITSLSQQTRIKLEDGRTIEVEGILFADSCLFDVFNTPILSGNDKEALNITDQCMIPRSLADKIGGNVIGLQISMPDLSTDYHATVGGVYEDFPLNSSIGNHVLLSMSTLPKFLYDGRENFMGNDAYSTFVRLLPDTDLRNLIPAIKQMLYDHLDKDEVDAHEFGLNLHPIKEYHFKGEESKTIIWTLSMLATIMLMSAGLNFLLIAIGQMGKRGREMAIRKCYGTSKRKIFLHVIGESLFFLLVSAVLAILIALSLANECNELLGHLPTQLLSTSGVWWIEGGTCLALLVVTGVIPAWMYCKTPVISAFRGSIHTRKGWKLALLSVQFFASGILLCLLVVIGRQYMLISHSDMGYEYENLGYLHLGATSQHDRIRIVDGLRRLPSIQGVASAYHNFVFRADGNNIWLENDPMKDQNMFNAADMYHANQGLIATMGFRLLQGSDFKNPNDSVNTEVIVEQRFVDKMKLLYGWDNDVIGKGFHITGHYFDGSQVFTIVGVIDNIRRGGFTNDEADNRPGVLFSTRRILPNLYIRFSQITPETVKEAQAVIDHIIPGEEKYLIPYKSTVESLTGSVRRFGASVVIAGFVILFITLIGLVGYTADEVQRRAKEIAIRKVNGTDSIKILKLFSTDIVRIAIPSLVLGAAIATLVGRYWLSQFTEQVSLSPPSMILCITAILLIILVIIVIRSFHIARSNPVDYLRGE